MSKSKSKSASEQNLSLEAPVMRDLDGSTPFVPCLNKRYETRRVHTPREGQRDVVGNKWTLQEKGFQCTDFEIRLGFSAENAVRPSGMSVSIMTLADWTQIFTGRFSALRDTPMEGPHPGFCLRSYPDIDVPMSTDEILVQPPFQNFQTLIPVKLDYLQNVFSRSFWDTHVISIRDVRPMPVVAASWKYTTESSREWKVLTEAMIVLALAPVPSSAAIDRLLGLSPIERTVRGKQIRQVGVNELLMNSQTSHSIVEHVMHQGMMCERRRRTLEYLGAVDLLLGYLDALIAKQRDLLNTMIKLEQLGDDIAGKNTYSHGL